MRLRADQQLFLTYLLLIAVLLVSFSVGADSFVREQLTYAERAHLRRELGLAAALYDRSPSPAPDSFAVAAARLIGRRVTVVAPGGRVLGESTRPAGDPAGMPSHAGRPEIREARARPGAAGMALRYSTTVEAHQLYAAMVTRRGDVLRLSVPLAEIDGALARVQRRIWALGIVALLLAIAFSLGFSMVVTRPLRRITAVAGAMAAGDLGRRLRDRRRDELGDVARSLDSLAEELQRRLGQLDAERAEMQALIDSMSEGVLAMTPAGTLRRANPAARRMFSLPAEPAGMTADAIQRRPEFLSLVRRALRGEQGTVTELVTAGRSLLGSAHPLPDGGAVVVFLDVSELRRLESVRRDFVANASHELKTPLTAIRGYSETLLDPDLPPELTRRFSEIVRQNADRLQTIIDDLLDLSRIESGGWRVEPEAVAVSEIAERAWSAQAERTVGLRFETAVAPVGDGVQADPAALHQIFTNLFSNAVRYTPPGGAVAVTARAAEGSPGWVEIEVRDTGSGIPAAHLPRIFERFYRADPARSRVEGGTGLGLAIVKHLVEAHGGTIRASSRLHEGTSVRFTLPGTA